MQTASKQTLIDIPFSILEVLLGHDHSMQVLENTSALLNIPPHLKIINAN